ncbi:MAG TPA: Gfo/Idh/MocA family oxidoreductase [Terriglobia bacterium]|nr:Gfo/Idh/MocA family oxidoreductase [Terriglobia bacterium]
MSNLTTRRDLLRMTGLSGAAAMLKGSRSSGAEEIDKKITLAFVGCAHIHTPDYVNLLKGHNDVRVKYVWDHDAARASKRAGELGTKTAKSPDEVWSDREVAGVVICSETNRHTDLVMAGAHAGKHMFVEKPMGITAKESYAMASAIEKAGVLFTTGYFNRTIPQHLFLKDQVAKGNFGKITRVRGSNCHEGSLAGWFDTEWRWMADPKIAGVGAFGDLGTHLLDILMWLLGDVDTATADIKVVTRRYGDCDESGEGLLKFKNGTTGTLAAGWVDVANPVTLEISGTEGHAVIVNEELYYKCEKVPGADGKNPWKLLPQAYPAPMHMFVEAVGGKKGLPLVSPHEAAMRVSVMEAMYQGARTRQWVKPL